MKTLALRFAFQLSLLAVLAGCGSDPAEPPAPPPPPPPTLAELTLKAAADLNPDGSHRASPVLVRVYELKSDAGFKQSDFFALFDKEQAALAGDLIRKEEFLMAPGSEKKLNFTAQPETRFIGVFAAFRELEHARWRVSGTLAPQRRNVVNIQIQGTQVEMSQSDQSVPQPQAN
jgi:type VI secretion system protein VasD